MSVYMWFTPKLFFQLLWITEASIQLEKEKTIFDRDKDIKLINETLKKYL